jgi:hypothetical protein
VSWDRGAGFRVTGAVVRKFVAQSGKVAFLTLAVPGNKGETKIDVRSFDVLVIEEIGGLGAGQTVQVTGNVDSQKLTTKAGADVMVDGYAKWVPALTVKAIKVEGSSIAPAANDGAPPPNSAADKGW